MAHRHLPASPRAILAATALVAVAVGLISTAPVPASGPLDQLGTSLSLVPADAAFHAAMLHNKEQIEAIGKSRAWASIVALPAVQAGLNRFKAEIASGEYAAQVKAVWENPEVQNGIKLLADMLSHEVFVCGDDGLLDLIELIRRVSNTVQFGQFMEQFTGETSGEPPAIMTAALADQIELLRVPNIVVGFRLKNRELALQELNKLEGLVHMMLMFVPQLNTKWKRTTIAGHNYLTLTLDGEMIPWEEIPLDDWREQVTNEGDVDKIVDRIKKMKLIFALGVRDDCLILAVGPSVEFLARLGQRPSLADRPEFKPLEKFLDRRLVALGYTSAAVRRRYDETRNLRDMLKAIESALSKLELSPDVEKEIRKDIAELTADLNAAAAPPGATSSFNFLTERGIEGYSYSWDKYADVSGGKDLTLLEHIGGRPILAVLARSSNSEVHYDMAVKWIKRAHHYFEEFALPHFPADDRERLQAACQEFRPLLVRLDQANRLLIQALADGQIACVLDAKFQSRQFHRELPVFDRPMPMIEPALVFGVHDARLLRKALGQYRSIFNDGVATLRKIIPDPDAIPPIQFPQPKATETPHGWLYVYELPEAWGLAREIAVSLALSDRVAIAALTADHAQRLLAPTAPQLGGVLDDPRRPRAAAASFDWAALVRAATPWVELVVREIDRDQRPVGETPKPKRKPKPAVAEDETKLAHPELKPANPKPERPNPKKSAVEKKVPALPGAAEMTAGDQVRVVLKALTAISSISEETYLDDGALVTHSLVEIRDF